MLIVEFPCGIDGPMFLPARCAFERSRERARFLGEDSIEIFGAPAVDRHPNIEAALNIDALNIAKRVRKVLAVVDHDWNDKASGVARAAHVRLPLARQHVRHFENAPVAREIVLAPESYQDSRPPEVFAQLDRPRRSGLELIVNEDSRVAANFLANPQIEQRTKVLFNPTAGFGVAFVADEKIEQIVPAIRGALLAGSCWGRGRSAYWLRSILMGTFR